MLKSIIIKGLYEEYDIDLQLNKDITLLVNNNGSFKTSILEIIDSISKGNLGILPKYNFNHLIVKYSHKKSLCTFEMKKSTNHLEKMYFVQFRVFEGKKSQFLSEGIILLDSEDRISNKEMSKSFIMEKSALYHLPSLREITLGLKTYPLKISYIPAKRLDDEYTSMKILYIQQEILKIVNAIRARKDCFMNDFKSAVVNDLFNFHLDDHQNLISPKTIKSLNSLKNIISEYNIDSKKYNEYVAQITLLQERSNIYMNSDESNSNEGFNESIKLLKSSSQISMINKIVPKLLEWSQISSEMNKPLDNIVNSLSEFFSYNKNIKFEISESGLGYYRKIRGEFKLIPMEKISSGELQLITILVNAYLDDISNVNILMIDEPELSMHIEWQSNLISFLSQLPQKYQIICSSHSPFITNDYLDKIITNFVQEDNDDL